jgi:hypothetical protein
MFLQGNPTYPKFFPRITQIFTVAPMARRLSQVYPKDFPNPLAL